MEETTDVAELLEVLRKEHQINRIIFGISIIVLALVLMLIAPAVIRSDTWSLFQTRPSASVDMNAENFPAPRTSHEMMATTTQPTATSTTSSTTPRH